MNRAQRELWGMIRDAQVANVARLRDLEDCLAHDFDEGDRHPVGAELAAAIQTAPRLTLPSSEWWRGRTDADEFYSSEQFSAPPAALAKGGRFNWPGESFWYLADGPQHAVMEIGDDWKPVAVVQCFRVSELSGVLNLAPRDVVDTGECRMAPLLMALIFGRWLGQIHRSHSGTPEESEYLLTRFVARCAFRTGFAAILSAGARTAYLNLQFPRLSTVDVSAVGRPRLIELGWHMSATTERVLIHA
jgi:RES domain-containing protein